MPVFTNQICHPERQRRIFGFRKSEAAGLDGVEMCNHQPTTHPISAYIDEQRLACRPGCAVQPGFWWHKTLLTMLDWVFWGLPDSNSESGLQGEFK